MEFSLPRQVFADSLSLVTEVSPVRSVRPILQNLLLKGNEDNTITLSATDLEIGIRLTVPVDDMKDPESILLPAARLSSLVKTDWSETVRVVCSGGKAEIRTKQGKFQLMGAESDDYPAIPEFNGEKSVMMNGDDFADAVQKTIFATARGDTRYALNGIFLSVYDHTAEFVASDTHRLSLVKKKVRNPDASRFDGIILTKGMSTLAKLASGKETVELNIGQHELLARTDNAIFIVRKVEGQFPRYNDVIPQKSENQIVIDREELLRGIHLMGFLANEETKAVVFEISDGELHVSASSGENGEGRIRIDSEVRGPDMTIKFNHVFVTDILKHLNEEKAAMQYKNAESPVRMDSGDFTHIVMPINR